MSKDYNAKYDTNDINGRDVVEVGAIENSYDNGPDYVEDKRENVYHDDHGKHAILAGGEDQTGPAFE